MSVRDGVTVGVKEGVRVEVRVDVCEGVAEAVGVIEGVLVNVAVGEKVAVGVNVAVAVGSGLPANAVSAVPSPPVFGITTLGSESSGCDDLHMRFGKLKAPMAIARRNAQIK